MKVAAEQYEVSLCGDCVALDANGEVFDGLGNDISESHSELMTAQGWDDFSFGPVDPEDEGHFSWSSCDGCGSTLGGTRFDYVAVKH